MSKSVAIIDTPKGCSNCVFAVLKFQYPWWSDKPNRKGFYCQLDEQRRVLEMSIEDETTKAEWCPLKPYHEEETTPLSEIDKNQAFEALMKPRFSTAADCLRYLKWRWEMTNAALNGDDTAIEEINSRYEKIKNK